MSSFSDTLTDYNTLEQTNSNIKSSYKYSNSRLDLCNSVEQRMFCQDQLQNISSLIINSLYGHEGAQYNWVTIYYLTRNPEYESVEKKNRKVIFPSNGTLRPEGDNAYMIWNGTQILDLDIKDVNISDALKDLLFDELSQYHWFLGITKSSSKKSLHVWTKIEPISEIFEDRKTEYLCNFRHKYSYIYVAMLKYASKLKYTKEDIFRYIDMAMCRPQQGIFIPSDNSYVNTNFINQKLDIDFRAAMSTGPESINWMFHDDLKEIFQKLDWFSSAEPNKVEITNYDYLIEKGYSKSENKKHYKHAQRWQLANTLTKIFGENDAYNIMCDICQGTPQQELKSIVKTAAIHDKPVSEWAIKELNSVHGFSIKIKEDESAIKEKLEEIDKEIEDSPKDIDPIQLLNSKITTVTLNIKHNQYLSDIKDEIIANLDHITLLESGAGTGKTEMIKRMEKRTLLILPFTSTIKSKIESSEITNNWINYYGVKKPELEDLMGTQSMAMTIDKFSKLNLFELDTANFEYIIIDESHLMFTSSYRDVMAPTIQRLANCKAKVIMMTGTPTGERVFFPNIKYIKVNKEDFRKKTFEIILCHTKNEQLIEMCKSMEENILDGKKILYPTDKGNLYYEQISNLIQKYVYDRNPEKTIKAFYYKRSNSGDESMTNINVNKTVGDNDIVFCTTFLSVGVDICDADDFVVYFSELKIYQDIEQFANRLRNKDLHIKIFLPKFNTDGFAYDYITSTVIKPLSLEISKKDLILNKNIIETCNDTLVRNNDVAKYNPIIQSVIQGNHFIKFDDIDAKYYIDETTYKLHVFEERYEEFATQLPVLINGMKNYNYEILPIVDLDKTGKIIPDDKILEFQDYMKNIRNSFNTYRTNEIFTFLNHINDDNIELYREILKGNYEIFKSDEYKTIRGDKDLYVENIEVLEKNTPIVLGLYAFYNCDTIKDIYKFCYDKKANSINYTKLNRIRKLITITYNKEKNRLDFPISKFIKDAYKFCEENPEVTRKDIYDWQIEYAAKYANSIPNLIVQKEYYEKLVDLTDKLWDVIIDMSKPKGGKIKISPFYLFWERKDVIDNIYGDANTKEFLMQELEEEMKKALVVEEDLPEFEMKDKLKEEDVNLEEVIHKDYEYEKYSKEDHSNDRFIRKQENTSRTHILEKASTKEIEIEEKNNDGQQELPF